MVFSTPNLSAGQHTISATYAGDTNYLAATSATVTQSVTDFQLSLTTSSQTVTAGNTASYNIAVTPVAGLTGSLSITCSQLPSLTSCDPLTISLNGQPATATLTVHTTAPVRSQNRRGIAFASLGFAPLLFASILPKRRRALVSLLIVAITFMATGLITGCSGSSKPITTTPGTPTGSTTFTITSTITSGTQSLTHTAAGILIVQ